MQPKVQDKTKCYYCERQLKMPDPIRKSPLFRTKDHVVPQSRGGKGNKENIVWCCHQCNNSKGSKTLWYWEIFLLRTTKETVLRQYSWAYKIPLIINNIRDHPLYSPEVDMKSFREFRKPSVLKLMMKQRVPDLIREEKPVYDSPTVDYRYLYSESDFDPYNFHEDYVKKFATLISENQTAPQ